MHMMLKTTTYILYIDLFENRDEQKLPGTCGNEYILLLKIPNDVSGVYTLSLT